MNCRGSQHCRSAAMAAFLWAAIIALAQTVASAAIANDRILLDSRRYDVLAGRHSVFAGFQVRLQALLNRCGSASPPVVAAGQAVPGRIGAATREGIQRLLKCSDLKDIPSSSAARHGVITTALWDAVMGGEPVPTVEDRAQAMTLSFEATDFGDQPEWNLCQDGLKGRYGPGGNGALTCYNLSDPCSFMTWGPRGATAGAGREIQHVLWMVSKQDPELIKRVFGKEYPALERFFRLKGSIGDQCDGPIPLKVFVCSVWLDIERRKIWDTALAQLGDAPAVRAAYARLYSLHEFDGAKLQDYYELWQELKIAPTEIDYAFFIDRITHLGGAPDTTEATISALSNCIAAQSGSINQNGAARRCLTRLQPHKTQPEYRLGRDVAYYLDAYHEGALSAEEVRAWARYVPLSATFNFGLTDETQFALGGPAAQTVSELDLPKGDSTDITAAELARCPASVLTPLHRKP
jgi:hypothetical protein